MRKNPIVLRVYDGITLKDVIKAVEDLLDYYEDSDSHWFDGLGCPLCRLFLCKECLWVVFHRTTCQEFAGRKFGSAATQLKHDEKWRAFRIKDLRHWLKELKRPGVSVVEG